MLSKPAAQVGWILVAYWQGNNDEKDGEDFFLDYRVAFVYIRTAVPPHRGSEVYRVLALYHPP